MSTLISACFDQLLLHIYLDGYSGYVYPRYLRRVFARSAAHRAWLAGRFGIFFDVDTGARHGVCGYDPV